MLAKIANIRVRQALKENHNIEIPASTIFIGGEHNTTTDEILLFDSEVPDSHKKQLQKLKLNLLKNSKRQLKKGWLLAITVLANKNRITGRN
jgi:uncharacterized protein YbcC (UPF0753/DUF2309 family)